MHTPVLLHETLHLLDPQPGEFFIDGTYGAGRHAQVILEKIGLTGKLLAIDWNERAIENCKKQIGNLTIKQLVCVKGNFAQLSELLNSHDLPKAAGLLLDLGLSSDELESSGRGFSFQKNEPLIMTYSDNETSVRDLLRRLTQTELEKIIREYGEERYAGRIAKAITERRRKRPLLTTSDLAALIAEVVPRQYERGRIHPATRTFQALRIYANREIENLERLLRHLPQIMSAGGRAAIISFHSLEDRLVKNYFRDYARQRIATLLTKKPIIATNEEIMQNPRSRSAKLRGLRFL